MAAHSFRWFVKELPQLASHLKVGICSAKDLAAVLRRPEFKIIWTPDAPDYLPKQVATELIMTAFVGTSSSDS
jgi:hypothetical protein